MLSTTPGTNGSSRVKLSDFIGWHTHARALLRSDYALAYGVITHADVLVMIDQEFYNHIFNHASCHITAMKAV